MSPFGQFVKAEAPPPARRCDLSSRRRCVHIKYAPGRWQDAGVLKTAYV